MGACMLLSSLLEPLAALSALVLADAPLLVPAPEVEGASGGPGSFGPGPVAALFRVPVGPFPGAEELPVLLGPPLAPSLHQ